MEVLLLYLAGVFVLSLHEGRTRELRWARPALLGGSLVVATALATHRFA